MFIIKTSDIILVILVGSLYFAYKTGLYLTPIVVAICLIIQIIRENDEA